MKYEEGDLIAIKTLENNRTSCIVVSTFNDGQFYYCYVVDTGRYRLVYVQEIEFIITKGFDIDLRGNGNDYELDYSFYEACTHAYAYTPYFSYPFGLDEDSSNDDEDE